MNWKWKISGWIIYIFNKYNKVDSENMESTGNNHHRPNHEKKCFVKVVAIGDSGVGKTSLI